MTINGTEYQFKEVTVGEVRVIRKWLKSCKYITNIDSVFSTEDDEGWEKACAEWKELCSKIFENPDEGLSLEKVSRVNLVGIPASFFLLIPEDRKDQKA